MNENRVIQLLTPGETAKILKLSPWTLARWRRKGIGNLRCVEVGPRTYRYRAQDVERLASG
ncbi:MAG: helix-turn-helix domain-containing protein [bacterium]|nr:helix-turn-helix domain-containing protein [bacterium]